MRVLLSKNSKNKLLKIIKIRDNCRTLGELSTMLGVKKKTLENWFYSEKSALPYELFVSYLKDVNIVEIRENNWGQINGGKEAYKHILKKYGAETVRKIQSLGGKRAAETKDKIMSKFHVNLSDPRFLEIYGALLGDGWLCNPNNPNCRWYIGLCGNLKEDKEYIRYCKEIIKDLTGRKGYTRERVEGNVIEFRFKHKWFYKLLNEQLNFPAGKKENLKIPNKIYSKGYDCLKYIIRGIFDTDGSFYLDKNKKEIPYYPIISIHMKEPVLLKQIVDTLRQQGFSVIFDESNYQIKLKGFVQLEKWMQEIGSSSKHFNKIKKVLQ